VHVPPGAVLALYARENGEGMLFGEVEPPDPPTDPDAPPADDGPEADEPARKRPHLKVVK
jgi:stringent starvation protein B